jgi:hypothetical protein
MAVPECLARLATCPADRYVLGPVIAKGGFGRCALRPSHGVTDAPFRWELFFRAKWCAAFSALLLSYAECSPRVGAKQTRTWRQLLVLEPKWTGGWRRRPTNQRTQSFRRLLGALPVLAHSCSRSREEMGN